MMGMDCINQQTAQDRDCSHCIWHTDGRCASWDCEYISRKEALEALEKVKAMSTHPNTPNTLKALDCISRQEAIDRINKQREHLRPDIDSRDKTCDAAYRICAEFIERLPSAQPEIEERMSETEQNVPNDDFISRKRAIDALMEDFKRIPTNAIRAKTVIEQLPPAKPEIIRCKDCKYADPFGHCDYVNFWNEINDFCSRAERKENR